MAQPLPRNPPSPSSLHLPPKRFIFHLKRFIIFNCSSSLFNVSSLPSIVHLLSSTLLHVWRAFFHSFVRCKASLVFYKLKWRSRKQSIMKAPLSTIVEKMHGRRRTNIILWCVEIGIGEIGVREITWDFITEMETLIPSKWEYLLSNGETILKYIWSQRRKWSSSLTAIIIQMQKRSS